jgi:hypothetical protein
MGISAIFALFLVDYHMADAQIPILVIDARDDTAQTNEDTFVTIDVMANDSYVGLNPSVSSVSAPSHGQATKDGNKIIYTPSKDYFGSDSFTYTLSNGLLSDTAKVSVTINPIPDNPVAQNDSATTNEDNSVIVNVLSNDSDGDGDLLVINSVTQGSSGTTAIISGNRIMYVPNPNFNGADSFGYTISDGKGGSSSATVSVTINPVNDDPVSVNDSAVTNEDVKVVISVLSNDSDVDGDSLAISSVGTSLQGTASINSGNTVTYAPNADFNGQASFGYTISDGKGGSSSATVSVTINPVNDPPVAADDSATTDEDVPATINVLANDSDVDNDRLTILSVTQPVNGTAAISGIDIRYEPNHNFAGQDSLTYTVSDGNGGQDTATVSITINPVDDFSFVKTASGLVGFDSLNNETQTRQQLEAEQGFWHYGGSAFTYFNPPAPTDLFTDSQGLHVGVNPQVNGTYAGYYAVTGPVDAKLFHAVITTPVRTISGDFFQNGLYVQTHDGRINYVTCVSITSTAGTSWHIIRTFGNFNQATDFQVLWSDTTPNQPLTRDCTIITNGINYLKMYIDGVNVYTNSTIDLQMPGPFLYFLEPQNSHAQMLYGVYNDFYMTKNETIKVADVPTAASRVDVVNSSGNVLASASVSNGTATLDIGMYNFPLVASIRVYDTNSVEMASAAASIYGGDEYAIIQR